MKKTCRECGEKKEITEYYNQKRYKDGLDPMCKVCRDMTSRKWAKENAERIKAYRAEYFKKNWERIKEYRTQYYQNKKKNEIRD